MGQKQDEQKTISCEVNQQLEEMYKELEKTAKEKGLTVSEFVSEYFKEKDKQNFVTIHIEDQKEVVYQENGATLEKVTIDLPKAIVNFYRMQAHLKGVPDMHTSLIAFDVADHVEAQITGASPEDWKETFNLTDALASVAGRESLLLGHQGKQ